MTSLKHNNRDLTEAKYQEPAHRHINQELSDDNIYIKRGNLKETYDELFGEALENYNAKQKRAARKITDYYQHVKKSKTLDLQREIVVTVEKKEFSIDEFKTLMDMPRSYKRKIAQNYWNSSQNEMRLQFGFVADQANRVKKVLDKKLYDLLDSEIDKLMEGVRELADVLGLEIEELPLDFPFFCVTCRGGR